MNYSAHHNTVIRNHIYNFCEVNRFWCVGRGRILGIATDFRIVILTKASTTMHAGIRPTPNAF